MNQLIYHGCNWNNGDVLYSDLENVLHRETSTAVADYCFGPQKTQFISVLVEHTVIEITQLRCLPLPDMSARHKLHVSMSQVETYLCIADGLFISTVAELLHA